MQRRGAAHRAECPSRTELVDGIAGRSAKGRMLVKAKVILGIDQEAATAVEAPLAGIDFLPGPDNQMFVLEVNAVPGWRALAPVCGIDIAKRIIAEFTS